MIWKAVGYIDSAINKSPQWQNKALTNPDEVAPDRNAYGL